MAGNNSSYGKSFSREDVKILAEENIYQGFFQLRSFKLKHRLFRGGWSEPISRELMVRHDAVGVLLFDPMLDQIALVEQIRIGVVGSEIARQRDTSPWSLELVAGLIDKDEQPSVVACRESVEEADVVIDQLEPIGEYYSSPGGSNEYFYLFVGRCDLSNAGGVFGLDEESEDIRVHLFSVADCWQMLTQGQFNNAHTLIAMQWLKLNYQDLKVRWC
jgi:ADP-ribose pyrophosphatase